MRRVLRKSAAKKKAAKRPAAKKAVVKRIAAKKVAAKRAASAPKATSNAPSNGGENPGALSRVTRVAKELAQQTTTAVSEGVEKVKEMGGSLVERVTG